MHTGKPREAGAQTTSHQNDIDNASKRLNALADKHEEEILSTEEQKGGSKDSSVSVPKEDSYPEGGLRAWLVVFGSWSGLMASLGIANTMGTFQNYISEHQLSHYSDFSVGWIFSVYAFMTFILGVYIGPIFDKHGPRYLVLAGSICITVSMFCLGECTTYWHFLLDFGFLAGLGTSLLFTPCFAVVGHYFKEKRGSATGIAATGGAMGGIVFPLTLQKLIPELGFAWSCRILGFILILLCTIANILLRSRLPPAKDAEAKPDFRIFKQRTFSVTVLAVFLIEWALFIPLTYITSYAIQKGFSRTFSYQILPILNTGSVFGRWLPGYVADRIGRYNASIIVLAITIVAVLGIWLPAGGTTAGLVIFALLFGFASGSNISLTPVCVGQLCETENYGRYYASCYTVVSLSCLTGVPIVGAIIALDGGSYWGLIVFVGTCYVGALLALTVAKGMATEWDWKKKF